MQNILFHIYKIEKELYSFDTFMEKKRELINLDICIDKQSLIQKC